MTLNTFEIIGQLFYTMSLNLNLSNVTSWFDSGYAIWQEYNESNAVL